MPVPDPTPIYRITHMDNLATILKRGRLCATNHTPNDGLPFRPIHRVDIQKARASQAVPCGPRGVLHDYVPFYFGPRSPMLYQLHTGWVEGYDEGQRPIIYLKSTVQRVVEAGLDFVFSDGQGIAALTEWKDDVVALHCVDWEVVYAWRWKSTLQDPDRKRRKQAEFLVHHSCGWELIEEIGVVDLPMKADIDALLAGFGATIRRPVNVHQDWYYS